MSSSAAKLKDMNSETIDMDEFLKTLPTDFTDVIVIGYRKGELYYCNRTKVTNESANWLLDLAKLDMFGLLKMKE